jgi:hypothetical protein
MRSIVAVALLAAVATLAVTHLYGVYRWDAATRDVRRRLDAARAPIRPSMSTWISSPACLDRWRSISDTC